MRMLLRAGAFALALCGLVLGGCSGTLPTLNLGSTTSLNTLSGLTNSYGVVLSAASAYKRLPLCRTGTTTSLASHCAQRSIVTRMQRADLLVVSSLDAADTFVKQNPTVDPSNYISAVQSAIDAYKAIVAQTGVTTP
jgi:hypothetical protein